MASVGEDIVILDLQADRYDCLMGAASQVGVHANGRIQVQDGAMADALVQANLCTPQSVNPQRAPAPTPLREAVPAPCPASQDVARALIVLTAGALSFRRRSLAQLVNAAPAFAAELPRSRLESRIAELLGAERRARPWAPFEGQCLQRAFLLRQLLASAGAAVDWVFGVRTWPFTAHCWLQAGDLVVGDRLDRVARFTPIMKA